MIKIKAALCALWVTLPMLILLGTSLYFLSEKDFTNALLCVILVELTIIREKIK